MMRRAIWHIFCLCFSHLDVQHRSWPLASKRLAWPRLLAVCLLPWMLLACAHQSLQLSGMVQTSPGPGPVPFQELEGPSWQLTGPLAEELARVPQALVKVDGRLKGSRTPKQGLPTLQVERYLLVDAGHGASPHVGTLRWDSGKLLLMEDGGPVLELRGPLTLDLRRLVGGKVWVVGPIVEPERLQVLEHGLLRPPAP